MNIAPPNPGICQRCKQTVGYRPAGEPCCNWRRKPLGRHRRTSEPQRCVSCRELMPHHRAECGATQ